MVKKAAAKVQCWWLVTAAATQITPVGFVHDKNVAKLRTGRVPIDALHTCWLSAVLSPVEIAGCITEERSLALSTCGRAATSETVLSSQALPLCALLGCPEGENEREEMGESEDEVEYEDEDEGEARFGTCCNDRVRRLPDASAAVLLATCMHITEQLLCQLDFVSFNMTQRRL